MDRWERRLQLAARAGAAPGSGVRVEERERPDPLSLVDAELACSIHPDEVGIVAALIEIAHSRADFRAQLGVLVRDGSEWVRRPLEVVGDVTGATVRELADGADSGSEGVDEPEDGDRPADDLVTLDRATVVTELARAMERCGPGGVAVLLVDIDRFKLHNDVLGEHRGDIVLRTLGRRIARAGAPAFVASMGGDEFVVILERIGDVDVVRRTADDIRLSIGSPVHVDGEDLVITATVGVAVSRPGTTADQLLHDADSALFAGKDEGRDRVELFDHRLEARTVRRVGRAQGIRRMLDEDALEVHFQPVVSLDTGMIIGAEALLRVNDELDGDHLVRPSRLLDAAEDSGLVERLGRFVLDRTTAHLAGWEDALGSSRRFRVSVNVSPVQLATPGFMDSVAAAIEASGVDPNRLSLELTESICLGDDDEIDATVAGLVDLGVTLGLDDFGTDRSSLGVLRRLPVDFVKLDPDVVAEIDRDDTDELIVSSAVALVRQLGFTAVAVGVERESQRDILRRLGVDAAQGYLFAAPMPAEELATWL